MMIMVDFGNGTAPIQLVNTNDNESMQQGQMSILRFQ